MKKYLLILVLALGVSAVNAQRTVSPAGGVAKPVDKTKIYPELAQPTPLVSVKNQNKRIRGGKPAVTTISTTPLGTAGNAFGSAFGSRTNIWYDKNINSIAVFHRSAIGIAGSTTISDIRYDYSTDGGTTWHNDQGPLYATDGTNNGRYPQGDIYNLTTNTNPANASVIAYGPCTNGTNWVANYDGTSVLGSNTHKQALHFTGWGNGALNDVIPEGMQIIKNSPNTNWVVAQGTHTDAYTNDSIFLAKGTYRSDSGKFVYDFTKTFYAPNGTLGHQVPLSQVDSGSVNDISTAWSDDGMIGYVVRLVNDTLAAGFTDSVLVPQVWKTTDGGNTWALRTQSWKNMNITALDTLLSLPGILMTTAFDVDCALDKNNNLHIAVTIGGSPGGYSISSAYGNFGVFDIYTTDGGDTWYGELVGVPELFRGQFGDGSTANPTVDEDNRPQVTRSWDGSKIFISWFDTDTAEFGGGQLANVNPDWHLRGLDVTTLNASTGVGKWTDSLNMTDLTAADGLCTFGLCSYYSINGGGGETVPFAYVALQSVTGTGGTVAFNYVNGGFISDTTYKITGHPVWLGKALLGVNEPKKNGFEVSSNYPNPFNGSTMVDVTLSMPEVVTIEVSNMIGQVLSTKTYKGLSGGTNHLTIEASNLATGLYLYKVTVGNEVVTRMMAVK